MKAEKHGSDWIIWPDSELTDLLTPEDRRRLLGGETFTLRRTGSRGEYDTKFALVPCTLLGRSCRVLMDVRRQESLMHRAGAEGDVWLPVINRYYPELTAQEMEPLLSGEVCTLDRADKKPVQLFMQWNRVFGWVRLSPRSWDETVHASSEETRLAFFRELKAAFSHPLKLTPSKLAKYFEDGCDRHLLPSPHEGANGGAESSIGAAAGNSGDEQSGFEAAAGNYWESEVVRYLERRFDKAAEDGALAQLRELFRNPDCSGDNQCSGAGRARESGDVLFLHHPAIFLPSDLRELLPIGSGSEPWPLPDGVYWGKIEPDLLLCKMGDDGVLELSVIDVKLASTPHISHIMQVSLYVSLLETFLHGRCDREALSERGRVFSLGALRLRVNSEKAWLWNGIDVLRQAVRQREQLSLEDLERLWFSIDPRDTQPYLDDFFRRDLMRICAALPDGAQGQCFCTGPQCESCVWQADCLEWGKSSRSVQLLPGLSRNAQCFLMERAREAAAQRGDSALFRSLLTLPGLLKADRSFTDQLEKNYEWKNLRRVGRDFLPLRADRQQKHCNLVALWDSFYDDGWAQREDAPRSIGAYRIDGVRSISIPAFQNYALILTCHTALNRQGEQVLYAWGLSTADTRWAFYDVAPMSGTAIAGALSGDEDVGVRLLNLLGRILQAAASRRTILHGYVYDTCEFNAIRDLAFRYLDSDSEDLARDARTVLFWLLGNGIGDMAADMTKTHPMEISPCAVSVLSEEINSLFVIPAAFSAGFTDVISAFGLDGDPAFAAASIVPRSGKLPPEAFYAKDGICRLKETERARLDAFLHGRLALVKRLVQKLHIINHRDAFEFSIKEYSNPRFSLLHEISERLGNPGYRPAFVIPEAPAPFSMAENEAAIPEFSKLLFRSVNELYLERLDVKRVRWQDESRSISVGKLLRLRSIRVAPAGTDENGNPQNFNYATIRFEGGEPTRMNNPVVTLLYFPYRSPNSPEERFLSSNYVFSWDKLLPPPDDSASSNVQRQELQVRIEKRGRYYGARPLESGDIEYLRRLDARDGKRAAGDEQLHFLYNDVLSHLYEREQQHLSYLSRLHPETRRLLYVGNAPQRGADAGAPYLGMWHDFLTRARAFNSDTLAAFGNLDGQSFSKTQRAAFQHVVENNFTLLQGPPGTGKTDFIARTIIALSRAFLEGGFDKAARGGNDLDRRRLRILICANSNEAVDNAIRKTKAKRPQNIKDRIGVHKLIKVRQSKAYSTSYPDPEALEDDDSEDRRVFVLGATALDCIRNVSDKVREDRSKLFYDLIIIDEASQVSVSQALMILEQGIEDMHVLIVGDQQQLPTIVHGDYQPKDPRFNLFSSVFDLYLDQAEKNDCKLTLLENYRMNEAISHYSASRIYGSNFCTPKEEEKIRCQTLSLRDGWKRLPPEDAFVLDPTHNLVLVVLKGKNPAALAQKELELAVRYAELLQEWCVPGIRGADGKWTPERVRRFWRGDVRRNIDGRLGIVSPTNGQNTAIRTALRDRMNGGEIPPRLTGDEFFIGTVDMLQGQERDAVIISYGVSDATRASQLKDFIYDRRRLNVALTRGRKKVILILTEALTERPIELLSSTDQDLLSGVSFLCGLERALKDPFFRTEQRIDEERETGHFFTDELSANDEALSVSLSLYGHGYIENGNDDR